MSARESDGFDHPRFVARGKELTRLMLEPVPLLPWPSNLFSQQKAMMSQQLLQQKPHKDTLCRCGKEHKQNIPWTRKSDYGHGFNVVYLCSERCKSQAVREFYK